MTRWLTILIVPTVLLLVQPTKARARGKPDTDSQVDDFTFMAIADPQINIPKWGTAGTEAMIDIMNELPAQEFPLGGVIGQPKGVLIAGDLVDSLGNRANWELYKTLFDPRGDARLRFPVYEGIGNHDLSSDVIEGSFTYVEEAFVGRNKERPGKLSLGPRGYHYSWDWGKVHFVCVNVFPGDQPRPVYGHPAPWNDPKASLAFLRADLAKHIGESNQPIILMWHYGLRGWGLDKWWTTDDLETLHEALHGYNVALILHGHEHRYERYEWQGYDVIMARRRKSIVIPRNWTPRVGPKERWYSGFAETIYKWAIEHQEAGRINGRREWLQRLWKLQPLNKNW